MELLKTQIEGLLILKPQIFIDARGLFFESYNEKTFESLGILDKFVQDNQSLSQKGVIRGLHYQKPPFAQAKLVRVIKGAALDVAVDIRKNSPTYGKYFSILLTGENNVQFYLPSGFAHGFASLEDDTIFAYKCSNFYNKESEESIIYNDPILNIDLAN
jgi:dTDP-4-dehydrorhamnose 3,5-epimerase